MSSVDFSSGPSNADVHLGMNKLNASIEAISLNQLLAAGLLSELDYLPADEAARATALEAELIADAAAGVDLRIRLIGSAVSGEEV